MLLLATLIYVRIIFFTPIFVLLGPSVQPGQAAALLKSGGGGGGGLKDVNSMVPTVLGLGSLKGSVQKPDRTHTASSSPSTTGPGSTNSQALASSPATSVTNGQINNNNKYKLTNSSKVRNYTL